MGVIDVYINPSLSKALRANDLLSGNDPSEGWGSQYTGNPRSLSLFLPTNAIKISPINAEVSLSRETSILVLKLLVLQIQRKHCLGNVPTFQTK